MNRMHARRTHRQSDSPSRSMSPGSPTGSPGYTPSTFESSPSPGHRDSENTMMYSSKALDNVKTDIALSLGVSPSSDEMSHALINSSLSQQIYHILVENWETWNAVLRLLRARSISQQVDCDSIITSEGLRNLLDVGRRLHIERITLHERWPVLYSRIYPASNIIHKGVQKNCFDEENR